MRDVAIIHLEGIRGIARHLFEGAIFDGLHGPQIVEALSSSANEIAIGGVTFKELEAARMDLDLIYAVISPVPADEGSAEPFQSLEAAALAIYLRFLPASANRATRRPWLGSPSPRQALVTLADGSKVLLTEHIGPRPSFTFAWRTTKLFPISGTDQENLLSSLNLLEQHLSTCTDFDLLAEQWHGIYLPDAPLGLALIARDAEGLQKEIESMRRGIPKALTTGGEVKTPAGSYFTANPLGKEGVAFVYPGVGSPYMGVGADLFALAPQLLDRFEEVSLGQAARYLHVDQIYPKQSADEISFYRDIVGVGEVAISTALLFTMMLRDVFKVRPNNAMGYSFGEPMMLAALGVWPEPTSLTGHLDSSPTFRTRLHGPMDAIRAHWGLPDNVPVQWKSYTVRATMMQAFEAIKTETRAYVSVVNTPEEVVLGGDPEACQRVLAKLGPAIEIPVNLTIHCEAVRSEHAEFANIHNLRTAVVPGIDFFSSSSYAPLELRQQTLSQAIADAYCKVVDFPRLVRRVHSNGARVFLEMGGRRNCCTWIEKILKGKPHVAIPCDSKGMGDEVGLLRAVARLVSHRVPMSLAALYDVD